MRHRTARASLAIVAALALSLTGCAWVPFAADRDRDRGSIDGEVDHSDDGVERDTDGVPEGGTTAVRCADGENIDIGSSVGAYEVTGACGDVAVRGRSLDIDIESAITVLVEGQLVRIEVSDSFGALVIRGDRNEVSAGSIDDVAVNGNGNVIVSDIVEDTVDVAGSENSIDADIRTDRVVVNGEGNRIGES